MPSELSENELSAGVQELMALGQRRKRDGGLGPFQRTYLTPERCRNAILAAEEEGAAGLRGMSANQQTVERRGIEQRALKRALEMEEHDERDRQAAGSSKAGYGSFIALIALLLPLLQPLLEWLIAKWITKKLSEV